MPRKKPTKPSKSPKPTKPPALSETPQKAPDRRKKGGPDAREHAMRLLAEGVTVTDTAEEVGVDRKTVHRWRDSPDGQRVLDAARKERAQFFADAADQGRRIFREAAPRAAQTIVDCLASSVPFEAVTAADHVLSRIGLPRTTKVETSPDDEYDLSKLNDTEQQLLEVLLTKARKDTANAS